MDRKMRKLLTMHGMHHPKEDANRLNVKRCDGRCGLIELESAYNIAIISLSKYIERGNNKLMKMVKKHEVSKTKYSLMKMAKGDPQTLWTLPRQEGTLKPSMES